MTSNSTKLPVLGSDAEIAVGLLDEWFDPIEAGLRDRVRDFGGRAEWPATPQASFFSGTRLGPASIARS